MNLDLRKKAKTDFEKAFSKLINNVVFRKILENMRKNRYIKLGTTRKFLVSEPNYYTTIFFSEKLLAIGMIKTQVFIKNKSTKFYQY